MRANDLLNLLRRAPLTADVILRMLTEDPLLFIVQSFRKLPPRYRKQAARLIPDLQSSPGLRAFKALLLDHRQQALAILDASISTKHVGRLESELLLQLGEQLPSMADQRTEARRLWTNGDVSAIDPSKLSGRLSERFLGEQTILRPGMGIQLRPSCIQPQVDEEELSNRTARVLYILTNSLPWTRSGYTYRTQSILKAVQDNGVEVLGVTRLGYPTTIGALTASEHDTVDGIRYERLLPSRWPSNPAKRLAIQADEITKIAQTFRPDVIHTTTNYQNGLVADAVSRATGVPWVYEMRGNMEQTWVARQPEAFQAERSRSEYYTLMRTRETEMAQRANAVIALSSVQKDELISRGIRADKITVIPNSVDASVLETQVDRQAARSRLGLNTDQENPFWVGTVTSVVDYEGLPTLLNAVRILRNRGHDVRCAIVGDGVALPDLKLRAAELGLERENAVVFAGRVPKPESSIWYQSLDVFVIPRIDTIVTRNVAPLKGLEAMALGVPVVTSDLPVLCDNITGTNQPKFEAGNADALAEQIHTLMTNKDSYEAASTNAKREAEARTWQTSAKSLRALYSGMTKPSPPTRFS
ncbi:glycosyltransferase family 4 protein [Actinomycetaceae bacterium MB13-C1-2]|nr:glycosyltransferase family 4 protein [Actinomycetaceae bacterium MB13-C1-2]